MFYVEDLVKSTKFYEEVIGLKIGWKDKEEEMVGFLLPENDSELVLHRDSNLPNPAISFQVGNVEEFCTYYKEAGYKVVLEPIIV
ncbi:MAG: VOC family protein [Candidatus Hodarchaeota archaeon]